MRLRLSLVSGVSGGPFANTCLHCKFISHCVVDIACGAISILLSQCLIQLSRSKPFGGLHALKRACARLVCDLDYVHQL